MAKLPNNSRTSRGLRDILFDEMSNLQSGEGNPTKALAVAKLAQQIMSTVRVEIEIYRLQQKYASVTDSTPQQVKLGALALGSAVDADGNATDH